MRVVCHHAPPRTICLARLKVAPCHAEQHHLRARDSLEITLENHQVRLLQFGEQRRVYSGQVGVRVLRGPEISSGGVGAEGRVRGNGQAERAGRDVFAPSARDCSELVRIRIGECGVSREEGRVEKRVDRPSVQCQRAAARRGEPVGCAGEGTGCVGREVRTWR